MMWVILPPSGNPFDDCPTLFHALPAADNLLYAAQKKGLTIGIFGALHTYGAQLELPYSSVVDHWRPQ